MIETVLAKNEGKVARTMLVCGIDAISYCKESPALSRSSRHAMA
jgi:hypothetical protein